MDIWNVVYLVNKNFCLLISKENLDHLNKKDLLYEEDVWSGS